MSIEEIQERFNKRLNSKRRKVKKGSYFSINGQRTDLKLRGKKCKKNIL